MARETLRGPPRRVVPVACWARRGLPAGDAPPRAFGNPQDDLCGLTRMEATHPVLSAATIAPGRRSVGILIGRVPIPGSRPRNGEPNLWPGEERTRQSTRSRKTAQESETPRGR